MTRIPTEAKADVTELKLNIGEDFWAEQLARKLYSPFGCVLELVRNGWAAGMPCIEGEATRWRHEDAAPVEIQFVTGHPLDTGRGVLLIMDRGKGITPYNRERFCTLGSQAKTAINNGGANQNRMGRMSALGLNADKNGGALWLTRDVPRGPVTRLRLTPSMLGRNVGAEMGQISPNDPLLGPYRNFEGTFTVVVIPNPTITAEAIFKEMPWALPRRADRRLHVSVNGIAVEPIPPPNNATFLTGGGRSVLLDVGPYTGNDERSGIALCDEDSGLAVDSLTNVHVHVHPLNRNDVIGCVFYPGLLAQMTSDRKRLRREFWDTEEGKKLLKLLTSTRARDHVNQIATKGEPVRGKGAQVFKEICDRLLRVYGPGSPNGGGGLAPDGGMRDPKPKGGTGDPRPEPAPPRDGGSGGGGSGGGGGRARQKLAWYRIGGKSYYFLSQPNARDPWYARLAQDGQGIEINQEHVLSQALAKDDLMAFALMEIAWAVTVDPENKGGRLERDRLARRNELLLEIMGNSRPVK